MAPYLVLWGWNDPIRCVVGLGWPHTLCCRAGLTPHPVLWGRGDPIPCNVGQWEAHRTPSLPHIMQWRPELCYRASYRAGRRAGK